MPAAPDASDEHRDLQPSFGSVAHAGNGSVGSEKLSTVTVGFRK